jgi:hypothetical protein
LIHMLPSSRGLFCVANIKSGCWNGYNGCELAYNKKHMPSNLSWYLRLSGILQKDSARTLYLLSIWPCVWYFTCYKYRAIYTAYTHVCMVLINPLPELLSVSNNLAPSAFPTWLWTAGRGSSWCASWQG